MIYTKGDPVQLPNLDLLTFLFGTPLCPQEARD